MVTPAHITPAMLRWARQRKRENMVRIATRLGMAPDVWAEWEREIPKVFPSFSEALAIAKALDIPFGFLWLSRPPSRWWMFCLWFQRLIHRKVWR